jgi:hypothetical protein
MEERAARIADIEAVEILEVVEIAEQQPVVGDQRRRIADAPVGGDRLHGELDPLELRLGLAGQEIEPRIGELARRVEHQRPARERREADQRRGQ